MNKHFLISFCAGLLPVIILSILALSQLGEYSYNKLGGIIVVMVQPAYVGLLFLAMIISFILKKKNIALGFLTSFGVGFFFSIILLGMGL
jgi:hypothetical protein